ncbi:MAG: hypothetical protein AAF902_09740 [Chloroflexota bacterium]
MHISTINDKRAINLVDADLDSDDYHNAIKKGAAVMIQNGIPEATYTAGYESGATVWSYDRQGYMVHRSDWIDT